MPTLPMKPFVLLLKSVGTVANNIPNRIPNHIPNHIPNNIPNNIPNLNVAPHQPHHRPFVPSPIYVHSKDRLKKIP